MVSWRAMTVGALGALALTTAACGGGSDSKVATIDGSAEQASASDDTPGGSGSGQGTAKEAMQDAMLDYARCMRDNGVDMPDPTFSGDGGAVSLSQKAAGMDSATQRAAQEACQPIMEEAREAMPPPSPEELARMRDEAVKFAQCMRDNGVDMPDPTFDGNGGMALAMPSKPAGPGAGAGGGDEGGASGPRVDPAFEKALEACEREGGPRMSMRAAPDAGEAR